MKISLAMITKNAATDIERCLKSVDNLVDEIVIVDTGSTDNTLAIINKYYDVSLYTFEWCDDFSEARNFAINKTNGDYILVLDSDEYIVAGERDDFDKVISQNSIGRILISSYFKRDNQTYQSNEYISRFFPREVRYVGTIHEQLDSDMPRVKMNIKAEHDGYFKIDKGKRNIPLLIKEVKKNPSDSYYLFQLGKELRIRNRNEEAYIFLKKAYDLLIDTVPYYGELVVELIYSGKERQAIDMHDIINQNDAILNNVSDFHFAKAMFYMDFCRTNLNYSGNVIQEIEKSFLKCLDLNKKIHTEYVQGTSSYLAAYNLGVLYEVAGNLNKALEYYNLAFQQGYILAEKRLKMLC